MTDTKQNDVHMSNYLWKYTLPPHFKIGLWEFLINSPANYNWSTEV